MKKHLVSVFILFVISISLGKAQSPILWGMTQYGGSGYSYGTIFKTTGTGLLTNVHVFGPNDNAMYPTGSLFKSNDGLLYGMTNAGGINGGSGGIIFSYNISTAGENDICDSLVGNSAEGILMQANNGLLYGLTKAYSNTHGKSSGTIFSYDISTGKKPILYHFGKGNDGINPSGKLIQVDNDLLYGVTSEGGVDSEGTIFSYSITTGSETILYNFRGGTDGKYPCSLVEANNGLLYGITASGGINDSGIIFSYNISTGTKTDIHDFGSGADGAIPCGALIQANNGLLYGVTISCRTTGLGTIFSYNISTNIETDIHDFGRGTDGVEPNGALIQASDGLLYGMTIRGGNNNFGTIFNYNISTETEVDIHDFTGIDGEYPNGNLLEVDSTTGINKLSLINNNISIYPNPTSGQFTIKTIANQNGYTVNIYNIVGENIYQSVLNNTQTEINLTAQPDGMYFVYLKSDEGVEVEKVVVAR